MSMVPFTAVPLWASVSDTGTNTPPVPALPVHVPARLAVGALSSAFSARQAAHPVARTLSRARDRKSTRLNSSHLVISYAVFCLKKKKKYHRARIYAPSNYYTRVSRDE